MVDDVQRVLLKSESDLNQLFLHGFEDFTDEHVFALVDHFPSLQVSAAFVSVCVSGSEEGVNERERERK
jgi:hypothetical protein